jgi:uncharacterized protein YggU (UPF0235/DUF167 family)
MVKVRVVTNAARESCEESAKGSYVIAVREPAADNCANRRVIELVAEKLGVEPRAVRMLSGHHRPSKLLRITIRL